MKIKQLIFGFLVVLLATSCGTSFEDKSISDEVDRLQRLEKELVKAISENKTKSATLICIQMKWEYIATTAGAASKCNKLTDIWDDKRRNYLIVMGIDPIKILGSKPKPKSFTEKLIDSY